MVSDNFTPISALAGGALIGIAATALYASLGRIAGISGIAGGLLRGGWSRGRGADAAWRIAFLAGLVIGAAIAAHITGVPAPRFETSWPVLVLGGLLVGFGTQLGGGCTSGHGICGIARLSPRSIVATLVFMATAIVTVFLVRHGIGGA